MAHKNDNIMILALAAMGVGAAFLVAKGAESVERTLNTVKDGVTDLRGLVPSVNLTLPSITMPNITMPNITMPNISLIDDINKSLQQRGFNEKEEFDSWVKQYTESQKAWLAGLFGGSNSGGTVSTPTDDNRLRIPDYQARIDSLNDPNTTLSSISVLPSSKETVIYNPEMGRITLDEMQPLDRLTITNSQQVGSASPVLPSSTKVFMSGGKDYGTEDNYITYLGSVSPLFASMYTRTADPND